MKEAQKTVGSGHRKGVKQPDESSVFSADERAAIRDRAKELKAERRASKADAEGAVLAAIEAMSPPDRAIAERIHALVKATAPHLQPKTWYGMPAYANSEGNVVCFFQSAAKFKARYSTFGFTDKATLDDGTMWPTAFAITELSEVQEARIVELLRRAVI